jgi:hypothetical protein
MANADDTDTNAMIAVRNELLCFLKNKSDVLSFDDNVQIICDFYMEEEIFDAKAIIIKLLPDKRLVKRSGSDKCKKTVEDMLKLLLDPINKLPNFYAINLSRLPPVGTEHIDISALLQEVTYLRSEVKQFTLFQNEMRHLMSAMNNKEPTSTKYQNDPSSSSTKFQNDPSSSISLYVTENTESPSSTSDKPIKSTGRPLMSDIVKKSVHNLPVTKKVVHTKKHILGTSDSNNRLKPISLDKLPKRSIDIFVSRLDPSTTENEVIDCTYDILKIDNDGTVKCEKLKSKFSGYSSYYICVSVDSSQVKNKVVCLMSTEAWPKGLLVRRYFKPKNGE